MRLFIVLIALIVFPGCIPPTPPPSPPTEEPTRLEVEYQNAAALVKEKKYQEAIAAYRAIVAESPQSPEAADALLEAAHLYVFYDNPQRDYAEAVAGFEEFLKRYPDHTKAQDARNWRAVLKTILDAKKENERLMKNIEELKELDIRHEERRRQ
ncbi:MAG: tetratricopeptide repeat protein [Betaproteobacteria bacterium]